MQASRTYMESTCNPLIVFDGSLAENELGIGDDIHPISKWSLNGGGSLYRSVIEVQ